jgi:hypothetical protein
MQLFPVLCNIKYRIFFSSGQRILVVIAGKLIPARVLEEIPEKIKF